MSQAIAQLLRAGVVRPEDLLLFRRVLAMVGRGQDRDREALEAAREVLGRVERAFQREEVAEAARELWPVLAYVYHAARGDRKADLLAHRVARGRLPQA